MAWRIVGVVSESCFNFSVYKYMLPKYVLKMYSSIKLTLSISRFPKTSTCPAKSLANYAEGERRNVPGLPRKDGNTFFLYIGKNRMKMFGIFFCG